MERSELIAKMLGGCAKTQKTYGQDINNLPDIVRVFDAILAEYSNNDIQKAFMQHLNEKSDFPTPACIVGILKPRKKELDKSTYITAKAWLKENKDAPFSLQERDYLAYVKEYEAQTMELEPKCGQWLNDSESKELLSKVGMLAKDS